MTSALLALVLLAAPAPASSGDAGPFAPRAVIPLVVSAGLLAGGIVCLGLSAVETTEGTRMEPGMARDELLFVARGNRVAGTMLVIASGLTAIVSAILLQFHPGPASRGVSFSLSPLPGGAFVSFGWGVR